ncbi:MAG TPA: hypothetical protein ENH14_00365 [candidate division WOR-3 bacterium]|uniref:Uncharacterized protein n=1 Tax=candidate division WOR-3 bacterium TaxID=2052148 RepID=A0A7V0Q5H6_UNCW3|nr:hypothetical protein [candidate division WOR-3 bacterium]
MNRKLVAGVLINEKGVLMSGHLPYCIIKHENKEFWFEVANMLEKLAEQIREDLKENPCE